MNQVISFSSGKGGVGKTSIVANLGYILSERKKKTLLIDADWTLGKLGTTLGVRPKYNIASVLNGDISFQDSICKISPYLSLLAAPSGVYGFEEMDELKRQRLFYEIECLQDQYDFILMDHGSGINHGVLEFAAASHKHFIVTTSEPTSYLDAYAIMKLLSKRYSLHEYSLIVTMSQNQSESEMIVSNYLNFVALNLNVRLELLEIFEWEPALAASLRQQKLFIKAHSEKPFAKKLMLLADKICLPSVPIMHPGIQFFSNETDRVRKSCQL